MTDVRPVEDRADLRRFIDYPYKKYRADPQWVPPLRMSEWDTFNPEKNPFYEHARVDLFLAERDAEVVGRVAVIDDDLHNKTHHDNLLFFGFFEARDAEAAQALFAAVEKRAGKLGRGRVRGPASPSLNDSAGFQLDAYDTTPYLMMPQNPPSYPEWTEAAGYEKIMDLYAWRLHQREGISERVLRLAERVERRLDFTIRPLDMRRYSEEVDLVLTFYNDHWEDHWGQIQYTEAEARKLAADLKQIIDPEMVLFLEIAGEIEGVAVGFPDANQVFHKIPDGKLFPWGIIHFLNKRRIIDRIRMPILGVTPEYRNKGLELALIKAFAERGIERGYVEAECSWILEDNEAINKGIRAAGGELYKTYRLYQKELAP